MDANQFTRPVATTVGRSSMKRRMIFAASLLACLGPAPAVAQNTFPNRPISIIVPFAAGGFSDTVARAAGIGLSPRLNVPVVVQNRAGGQGLIAAGAVIRAPADGYTLFLANISTNAIVPNVKNNMPFEIRDELEPVALLAMTPNIVAVSTEVPVKSVKELIDYARTKKLNFGTPGVGSTGHLTAELLAARANVKFLHVPYKGSPQVLPDLINGNLHFTIDNVLTWAPQAKANRVRAIAVTGKQRSPLLPDVPTMDESGYPAFLSTSWFGLAAPKGTPREVITRLNAEVNSVLATVEFQSKVVGAEVGSGSAESFKNFIASERQKWGEVTRAINLTAD